MLKEVQTNRKYNLALICLLILVGCFGLCGLSTTLAGLFPELIAGLGIILTSYGGSNVFNKWVTGKNTQSNEGERNGTDD